jgi:hypothetical protein
MSDSLEQDGPLRQASRITEFANERLPQGVDNLIRIPRRATVITGMTVCRHGRLRSLDRHAMIADHRRHSFDAEIPRIKLLVLAGQLPALGHRRMHAQWHAAVPGAGRVALDQRRREEGDGRPAPHRHGHLNHLRYRRALSARKQRNSSIASKSTSEVKKFGATQFVGAAPLLSSP